MFKDRQEAGRLLAEKLREQYGDANNVLLALPRGGVVIGKEVADTFRLPLGVIVTRKLASPLDPEYAIGSLAETGDVIWEKGEAASLDKETMNRIVETEKQEVERRVKEYRSGQPLPEMKGKTVILIDDGLATGLTMKAAIAAAKAKGAGKIVVAVPHGAGDSLKLLRSLVDDVVVLEEPDLYFAVGGEYENFSQVTDAEVKKILHAYE